MRKYLEIEDIGKRLSKNLRWVSCKFRLCTLLAHKREILPGSEKKIEKGYDRISEWLSLGPWVTSLPLTLTSNFQLISLHIITPLPCCSRYHHERLGTIMSGLGLGACEMVATSAHQVKEMRLAQASVTEKDAYLDILS